MSIKHDGPFTIPRSKPPRKQVQNRPPTTTSIIPIKPQSKSETVTNSTPPVQALRRKASAVKLTHSTSKRKLIVRGLKKYKETRNSGGPPIWTKEFPCRSRFHPDSFIFDSIDGAKSAKRNTEAMNKCLRKGGRCDQCGIATSDLCTNCRKCENDCMCKHKRLASTYYHTNRGDSTGGMMTCQPRDTVMGNPSLLQETLNNLQLDRARDMLEASQRQYETKRDLASSDSNPLISALGGNRMRRQQSELNNSLPCHQYPSTQPADPSSYHIFAPVAPQPYYSQTPPAPYYNPYNPYGQYYPPPPPPMYYPQPNYYYPPQASYPVYQNQQPQ